jgi:hypothetical protein
VTAPLAIEIETLIRRLAAKALGEYPPPHLRHAAELLADLEAAEAYGAAAGEWAGLSAAIRDALRSQSVDGFLRLPPIAKTLHPPIRSRSRGYLEYLARSKRFSLEFQRALTESPVGQPLVNPHYPLSSPLLVQHGYHLLRLLEATDFDLETLALVVDFGGGYGSFFRLLRNLGYRGGYLIWDIPLLCALQRFYLRNMFPTDPGSQPPPNLEWLPSGAAGAVETVASRSAASPPSLFVATWSLSETPLAVRETIAPALGGFTYILCAYQRAFGGCDNRRYFSSLERALPGFDWHHAECPVFRNNFYLIGRNRAHPPRASSPSPPT